MKLQNMSYGTLILLIIFCIIDSIETKISGFFTRKPQKTYRYFSGNIMGMFPGLLDEKSHTEIESISDNIRYELSTDTWEVFKISHTDFNQYTDIHQGRHGYWTIVDDKLKIDYFKKIYLGKSTLNSTPVVQM